MVSLENLKMQKTDIGYFPKDWKIEPLPKHVWFQEGPGLRNWQFKEDGLKVINVTNLEENGFLNLSSTRRHISWEEFEKMYRHFLIDENDVVIASSGNSYCKVAIVRRQDLPLLMNTSVIRFKPLSSIVHGYMLTYLKSYYFKNQIDLLITGGAQPNFGPAHLKKILIPLPPTKAEQTAIATALNDADALIQKLEQLIAKKRLIKQGAMQVLLKPKEGWVVKKLGEIAEIEKGQLITEKTAVPDGIPVIGGGMSISYYHNKPNRVGITITVSASGAYAGYVSIHNYPIFASDCSTIKESEQYNIYFLYFALLNKQKEIYSLQTGGGQPHVYPQQLRELLIPIPKQKTEQTRIAQILSDMDNEIEALEKQLEKYKMLKQGMMQVLLTGKIRLNCDS